MAQDTSLWGLRRQMVTSFYGARDGLDGQDFTVGPKDLRVASEGWSSAGSTIVSTGYGVGTAGSSRLAPYGVSIVGATTASGTTGYLLSSPVPGVYKTLINPSTGIAVISTTDVGAFFASTGSVTSTHQFLTMSGKGTNVQLIGITTNLYAPLTQQYSSLSTSVSFL